jgi:nucleoside-diphosphate-sugar epimerase
MMNVLVTGASGFVGRAILEYLNRDRGIQVSGTVRQYLPSSIPGVTYSEVAAIGPETDWSKAVSDIDLLIHTAGRVHVMSDSSGDSLAQHRRVNVAGTLNLARQAAEAGVKRFIFLSSIKVHGDATQRGHPFCAEDTPAPNDAYGESKLEAELSLQRLSQASDMEVVVIRPPLVYGPGVRANFLAMMRWIQKGWPVPFGHVDNRRSLVALPNLVDLIKVCCIHPAAAGQIFLVSDGEDVSTTELLNRIGDALRKPVKSVPLPAGLVRTLAALAGKKDQIDRLFGSLQVDICRTRTVLSWSPIVSMDEALKETARYFLDTLRR